jgi:ribonucleoside-diphosphate reductase beta chain
VSLLEGRDYYKPFSYPWAYDAFVASEQMHWLAREVPLGDDVKDWSARLTNAERALLTQIFRFFTQADVDVAAGYIERYLPWFKPPEVRMMLCSFAAREAVHMQAYSALIDQIGMPESEYSTFASYKAMRDKHEFMSQSAGPVESLLVNSVFGEGLQLFASFVVLLNFTRFGKMRGMGQIVSWSIRDEALHVEAMSRLLLTHVAEQGEVASLVLHKRAPMIARAMVELEDAFVDLVYGETEPEGLSAAQVKGYIRYIADARMRFLGLGPVFGTAGNPLPWVDVIVFGKEHTNFFENRATDYAKGAVDGWDDMFQDAAQ